MSWSDVEGLSPYYSPLDPPLSNPVDEEASYYEWLEEQEQELLAELEEVKPTWDKNLVDYNILDEIPLEDLPF